MNSLETQELTARLEKLAFRKTTPFCYQCYRAAPTGRCELCQSDDLMRELAGEGVEYGVDWVIKALVRDDLDAADTSDAFEQSIIDCYPETTKIGWIEVDTATALKQLDPVSWDMAASEWIDNALSDGQLMTFDNGGTYYWTYDVERFLDDSEEEAA